MYHSWLVSKIVAMMSSIFFIYRSAYGHVPACRSQEGFVLRLDRAASQCSFAAVITSKALKSCFRSRCQFGQLWRRHMQRNYGTHVCLEVSKKASYRVSTRVWSEINAQV